MMKKKVIGVSITVFLFMGIVFSVIGHHERINGWEGVAHAHCGHDESVPSATGTLTLSLNETGNLAPYQPFTVSGVLANFTELNADPYYNRTCIAIPGLAEDAVVMDNHLFSMPLSTRVINRRVTVDIWGGYSGSKASFDLYAPAIAGTYTLMMLALAGANQSSDFADRVENADMNITYVEGTIQVTVAAPDVPEPPAGIPGFMIPIMVVTVGVVAAILIRKHKREL
jgi:hypothetical protein